MRGYSKWSYAPYRPLLTEEMLYICRVVPSAEKIHIEWLDTDDGSYKVFYRKRGDGKFSLAAETGLCSFDIQKLIAGEEYEFFIEANGKRSRVRLAKCADAVGTVVNYLHPEDDAYSFSGKYLCSTSLVKHPDGYLLASMDLFAADYPQNLTLIFRSDDNGETWHYVSELMPCFWGKMFRHTGVEHNMPCN